MKLQFTGKIFFLPGSQCFLQSSRVLPYSILRLRREYLPNLVCGYLEDKGHFLHHMAKQQDELMSQQQQSGAAASGGMNLFSNLFGSNFGLGSTQTVDLSSMVKRHWPRKKAYL